MTFRSCRRVVKHGWRAVALVLAVGAGAAVAQEAPPHRGPPPEAYTACNGQSEGAACSMTTPRGTLSGTCAATPEGQLACRPAPPPEAFSACDNQAAGAACTVTLHDRTLSGTCAAYSDGRMVCRPEGPPPGGAGQ